eukprot:1134831-Heterocapsa_arctica.AAC.1
MDWSTDFELTLEALLATRQPLTQYRLAFWRYAAATYGCALLESDVIVAIRDGGTLTSIREQGSVWQTLVGPKSV